jgi:pimeloyl-ACP methyl ester carboxylesterase
MKKHLSNLIRLLGWLLVLLAIGMVVLFFAQRFLLFPGRSFAGADSGAWQTRLAALNSSNYTPVAFEGPTPGSIVNGLWAPGTQGPAQAILWFHERHQNITELNQQLKPLTSLGIHVLAFQYRGYGNSPGDTTEANLLADAGAALAWLRKHDEVIHSRIFVGGIEFGANVAIKVAAREPVSGIVAISPLPDMRLILENQFGGAPLGFLVREPFDLAPDLPAIAVPVFIAHGIADKIVPIHRVELMVSNLGKTRVVFKEVEGAGHGDVLERGGKDLLDEIDRFIFQTR